MKKALIGAGGFARDVKALMGYQDIPCFVDSRFWTGSDRNILPLSQFDPLEYEVLVTVANPFARALIVESLPLGTQYFTVIHPSAQLLVKPGIKIGKGCVVSANCLLVDGISIGDHCHLNLGTILGHDVQAGDYLTTAPGVKIMGNNIIGKRVYFGTNASTKEKITIVDDVTVGLNAGVVSNLREKGVYVGTPARKIK
jgi:sugar O-acyltransferase (sialic acid O-acetyltransferase NeuD family)